MFDCVLQLLCVNELHSVESKGAKIISTGKSRTIEKPGLETLHTIGPVVFGSFPCSEWKIIPKGTRGRRAADRWQPLSPILPCKRDEMCTTGSFASGTTSR